MNAQQPSMNAPATFLQSHDDLRWLRDTVPQTKPYRFACAILYGNTDFPQRIVLAERDHIESVTVTLTYNELVHDYRVSIGKGWAEGLAPECEQSLAVVSRPEMMASAIAEAAVHGAIRKLRRAADRLRFRGDAVAAREADDAADLLGDRAMRERIEREGWTL
jgi:hypothetical protein